METPSKNYVTLTNMAQVHLASEVPFVRFGANRICEHSIQLTSLFEAVDFLFFYHNPMQCSYVCMSEHSVPFPLVFVKSSLFSLPVCSYNIGDYASLWAKTPAILLTEAPTIRAPIIWPYWNCVHTIHSQLYRMLS